MSTHFITKCLSCKRVISQCRCAAPNKSILWATCNSCAGRCLGDVKDE